MKQQMDDVPETRAEYKRQKGPVPLIAIMLAIALVIAGLLYLLPIFSPTYP